MKDCQNDKINQDSTVVGVLYFAISTPLKVKHDLLTSITATPQTKTSKSKYAFPTPEHCNIDKNGLTSCSYERVLSIYNKVEGKAQKRLTEFVEQWFVQTAKQHGWVDAMFINDCAEPKRSSCLLLSKAGLPYAATH